MDYECHSSGCSNFVCVHCAASTEPNVIIIALSTVTGGIYVGLLMCRETPSEQCCYSYICTIYLR